MTLNISKMTVPAIASIEGGADGISTINTIKCITDLDLDKMVAFPIINGKSSGYN